MSILIYESNVDIEVVFLHRSSDNGRQWIVLRQSQEFLLLIRILGVLFSLSLLPTRKEPLFMVFGRHNVDVLWGLTLSFSYHCIWMATDLVQRLLNTIFNLLIFNFRGYRVVIARIKKKPGE
jgi:hypothetical protein